LTWRALSKFPDLRYARDLLLRTAAPGPSNSK